MTLPNFLICGIQKGGTTALYEYLRAHPDVFMPKRKELCFFDQHWNEGLDWYAAHFAAAGRARAIGEASPHYMRFEHVAQRIRETLVAPKLLFILRDPTSRAFSNYNYNLGRGQQDPRVNFEQAIATDDGRLRYLDKGFYLRDLGRFAELVGREHMLVLHAEDLRAHPERTLARAFRHIGVDPARWSPTTLASNTTSVPKSPTAQRALFAWGQVRRRLLPFVPAPLARATRGLRAGALAALPASPDKLQLADETRAALQGFYAEANRGLADWLRAGSEGDHPLPTWLEAAPLRAAG